MRTCSKCKKVLPEGQKFCCIDSTGSCEGFVYIHDTERTPENKSCPNKTYLLSAHQSYTAGTILVVADSLDEIREMVQKYIDEKFGKLKQYINPVANQHGVHEWTIPWEEREKIEEEVNSRFPEICLIDTGFYDYYLDQVTCKWRLEQTVKDLGKEDGWFVDKEFYSDLPKGFHYVIDYCA